MKHEYTAILNHLRVKHNMTLTNYTQVHIKQAEAGGDQEESVLEDEEMIEDEMEEENGNTEAVDSNQDDQFYVISTETS